MSDEPVNQSEPTPAPHPLRRIARSWCRVLLGIVIALMVAGALAPMHRWFDFVASFQVQFFVAAMALLLLLLLLRSWMWSVLAVGCLAYAGWMIAPLYAPGAHRWDGTTPPNLRVMLFNVHQPGSDYDAVLTHIREQSPDIVVLQEVNERWFEGLAPLIEDWPHAFHQPGGTLRGMAVFSRHELRDVTRHDLNNPISPSIAATFDVGRTAVSLLMVHPWPPVSEVMTESRDETLDRAATVLAGMTRPTVLIGDLNITPWSPIYRAFEDAGGLVNARLGHGVRVTYPMDDYALLRVPIDHVLVSPDIAVAQCRAGDPCGSDHAPLIVDLVVP